MSKLFRSDLSRRIGYLLIPLVFSLFTLACGSSGGGGSAGVGSTGAASVFLTDAASDQFDEILLTITSIELLGNRAPVTIFSGRETVDLKDLENFSDLFVYAENVPVGTYHKIRMRVSEIELIEDGAVTEVDPPANGKIDLLPHHPFEIRHGINLVIEIDMDAKKSIHISNGYRFRPVIFVTIRETRSPHKLARVHGEITELLANGDVELCSSVFMAARTNSSEEGYEDGGLGDRHRCMTVEVDGDTGIFDSNGDPAHGSTLRVGDEVTVFGRFHMVDDNHDGLMAEQSAAAYPLGAVSEGTDPGHREHHESFQDALALNQGRDWDWDSDRGDGPRPPRPEIVFLAYVIEVGPPGTFLQLRGIVASELDDQDEFDFAIAPGQGFGDASVVTALIQDGTRIFSKRGIEVDLDRISPNTAAKIDGVFATDAMGLFYKTALLMLELEIGSPTVLRGEILSANEMTRRLLFAVDGADECIDVPEEAGIFLIRDDGSGGTSEEAGFDALTPGLRSDVYGSFEEIGDCFLAETIIAFPIDCLDSTECPVGQYCAKDAGACDGPGICKAVLQTACIQIFDPVCGCDGVTYSNECIAQSSGASVASEGPCEN